MTQFRRPHPYSKKRVPVSSTIDDETKKILEMLGFDIPRLIEETLNNVAGHKRCPCCKREVRPLITGRKIEEKL